MGEGSTQGSGTIGVGRPSECPSKKFPTAAPAAVGGHSPRGADCEKISPTDLPEGSAKREVGNSEKGSGAQKRNLKGVPSMDPRRKAQKMTRGPVMGLPCKN